jgi:hypothetical protein
MAVKTLTSSARTVQLEEIDESDGREFWKDILIDRRYCLGNAYISVKRVHEQVKVTKRIDGEDVEVSQNVEKGRIYSALESKKKSKIALRVEDANAQYAAEEVSGKKEPQTEINDVLEVGYQIRENEKTGNKEMELRSMFFIAPRLSNLNQRKIFLRSRITEAILESIKGADVSTITTHNRTLFTFITGELEKKQLRDGIKVELSERPLD